jgi:hypothetical protein
MNGFVLIDAANDGAVIVVFIGADVCSEAIVFRDF